MVLFLPSPSLLFHYAEIFPPNLKSFDPKSETPTGIELPPLKQKLNVDDTSYEYEQGDERMKKRKVDPTMDNTVISELQDLVLHPLTDEPPLPLSLSILAAFALETKCSMETDDVEQHVIDQARQEQLGIFEKHIGPYQDIIDCAFFI